MKNKIHYSFLLCLTVIASLVLLSIPGELSVGGVSLREIDLLADIRQPAMDTVSIEMDSTLLALDTTSVVADSIETKSDTVGYTELACPKGTTCVEDYGDGPPALAQFLEALKETKRSGSTLRIAFFGDSFIEGDVFCGAFRDTLQTIFGGRGVGYVPITSNVTGFRNTIKHRFENWETTSLIERTSEAEIGPAGFTFIPRENNWLEFRPSRQRYLREFNTISLFYKSLDSAVLHYSIDTTTASTALTVSDRIEQWKYQGKNVKSVLFEFHPYDSLMVYGACFEGSGGVYVDNFSIRGNSGLNLNRISSKMFKDFNRYRNYKLIILQFGLNLVGAENLNYAAYVKRMVRMINELKRSFPSASILLLSVSDRSVNDNGEFKTMDAIPLMRDAQRLIAKQAGIAFWDMFEAMGGEGSMVRFVNANPALGARDYTHLTFKGGRNLSWKLASSLLFELEKYEHQNTQMPDSLIVMRP